MEKQSTDTLLLVEPVAFGFNRQTASTNYFQHAEDAPAAFIREEALREFNQMTDILRSKDIRLIIVQDTPEPHTPDAIFPNNRVSFHNNGSMVVYPMFAENRRLERRLDISKQIEKEGFIIQKTIDYSPYEKEGLFLEGTGSMVLDRVNRKVYAALSERTHPALLMKFCKDFHYIPCFFSACQTVGTKRLPVYHTNVMMCIGDRYAIVCLGSIDNADEREKLIRFLTEDGKEMIIISEEQMHQFAGNMLQVENQKGEKFLIMSETAGRSLTNEQIDRLSRYNEIIRIPVPVIEKYGGGSVRCMMAEVFLPQIQSK